MAWQTYASHTLIGGDIPGGFNVSGITLPSGTFYFRSRLVRGGFVSAWSSPIADTIVIAPSAPLSLVDISPAPDTTPDFTITLQTTAGNDTDAKVGDVAIGQYSTDGGSNWIQSFSHTLISGDIVAASFNVSSILLVAGDYLFRARLERTPVASAWTANVPVTVVIGSNQPSTVYVRSLVNKNEVSQGNDTFTKLLLHCDGTNNSTTFTNNAIGGTHTATAGGNAKLITATKKFGSAAASFDATANTQISLDGSADFAFGAGIDFTVDFWVNFASNVGTNTLCDFRGVGNLGYCITIYVDANGRIFFFSNTSNFISGTTIISGSAWYHVALTRSGTNTRLFLNGVQEGATYTGDTVNYPVGVNRPCFGGNGNDPTTPAVQFNGLMDEIRVDKGIARWTANFTPPAVAYKNWENLLLRAQGDKG